MSAERALELAKLFKPMPGAKVSFTLGDGAANEVEAILRHYAEIMRQEPALYEYETWPVRGDDSWFPGQTALSRHPPGAAKIVASFIIKPEPLK